MTNKTLPAEWDQVLSRFTQTLAGVEQTLGQAAAWEAASARADAYAPLLAESAPKLAGLEEKATAIAQWVDSIDSELRASEELLRVLLTHTETVRQKLANWAGRAIG